MLPTLAVSLLLLFLFRHHVNALAAGETRPDHGVNVTLVKGVIVAASTLHDRLCRQHLRIVGWVGLVIPHLARMFAGASYSRSWWSRSFFEASSCCASTTSVAESRRWRSHWES